MFFFCCGRCLIRIPQDSLALESLAKSTKKSAMVWVVMVEWGLYILSRYHWALLYLKFRAKIKHSLALVLLSRFPSLHHIGYKLFKIPTENQGFDFLLQFKVLGDIMTVILVNFAILHTTPHVGIFSYQFGWAE